MPLIAEPARLIAFYLPQFHPIPENDQWWGKGFTEWLNVVNGHPLFPGHYQPHLPADLGFYDLRVSETRQAQADLAREYGLHGFCYYHYWFRGKRLLERPFQDVLSSGHPDFPFCLCWANESWTRAWDGRSGHYLVRQEYSADDDRQHIRWLIRNAFEDKRYIRIQDKPLFLVYRASLMDNPSGTASVWREEARRAGLGDVFLCQVESFHADHADPALIGFDASVEFQPDWPELREPQRRTRLWRWMRRLGVSNPSYGTHRIYDYAETVEVMLRKPIPAYRRFPCVMPSWDNSARRKEDAVIFADSTPAIYHRWLLGVLNKYAHQPTDENLVFINAWNEWGEGNHLEPCQKWGHAYLQATQDAALAAQSG